MNQKLTIAEKIPFYFTIIIIIYFLLGLVPVVLLQNDLGFFIKDLHAIILDITFILCLISAITFYKQRKLGWVLTFFVLIFFCSIQAFPFAEFENIPNVATISSTIMRLLSWILLFFMPILVLFFPSIRKKFRVERNIYFIIPIVTNILFWTILYFTL